MKPEICCFYLADDITLFHTLYPILKVSKFRKHFYFTDDLDYVLNRAREPVLLLVRFYKRREIAQDVLLLKHFRDRFRTVVYFDDTASADELNTAVFPYVDIYYKKQLQRDRDVYTRPSYGKRAFTDYYHRTCGLVDDNEEIRPALLPEELRKLHLAWNLGIGCYPKSKIRNGLARRLEPLWGMKAMRFLYSSPERYRGSVKRIPRISARFGTNFDRRTVAFHREIFLKQAESNSLFLTGRVSLRQFNQEMRQVRAVLSPFGWGEICFRDFEAILNQSVLIKPDMSHIETWPDVYLPDETYVSVDWDGKNLLERCNTVMDTTLELERLRSNAYEAYQSQFRLVDHRVQNFLERIMA
ncbi:hypothetical protein [Sediminispirochaeta bajacaliforniensis]|uniref:hypothetical protein n=1 Tax=Sediminispirochaeta bajacaliforniensis TaxID=148 RepID=UPI00037B153B|nr:hypothetical protein [Sediminispirochaeta bajacaliforniensis]